MAKLKQVEASGTVAAVVADAQAELGSLRDEAQEVVDNAPDSLRETGRNATLAENAEALSDADSDIDIPAVVSEITVTYREATSRRALPRHARCSNAFSMLDAAASAIESWVEKNPKHDDADDATAAAEAMRELMEAAEATEWPGMFG